MSGWVKIHRQFTDWEWYSDKNVMVLFLHLLLTVNHKASKFRGVDVPAGSRVAGLEAMSEQLGMSVQKIRTAYDKLKSTKEITIKKTNKFSIISITKWDEYQGDNNQITIHQQTDNKQITPSKECKNVRSNKIHLEISNFIPTPAHYQSGEQEKYTTDEINWLAEGFKDYAPDRKKPYKDLNRAFGTWLRSEISHRNIDQRRKSLGHKSGVQGFADLASEVVSDLQQGNSGHNAEGIHSGRGHNGGNGRSQDFNETSRPENSSNRAIQISGPDETAHTGQSEHEISDSSLFGTTDIDPG